MSYCDTRVPIEAINFLSQTRIVPALLGLRQALKISIYDYLSKFHQINAVSQYKFDFGPCPQFCSFTLFKTYLKTYVIANDQLPVSSQT